MDAEALGNPRLEYRPLPATPIAIALLLITIVVAIVGLPLSSLSQGSLDLWWLWVLPPGLIAAGILLGRPTPLVLYDKGLDLPLPLWKRLVGVRRRYAFAEVVNLYPRLYYVAGALLSPFAASVGTVEHLGLGLEMGDGREALLRFTPSIPRFSQGEDEGYQLVADELRNIFAELGQPWVAEVTPYTVAEVDQMKRRVARPLLPFTIIVAAFFAPVGLIPLFFVILTAAGIVVTDALVGVLLAVGLVPTLAMLSFAGYRSRVRRDYLKEISKYTEWSQAQARAGAT